MVGLKGNTGQCVYSASKAGLEGFTRSLAKEVASRNIRVNLLAPGNFIYYIISIFPIVSPCLSESFSHLIMIYFRFHPH